MGEKIKEYVLKKEFLIVVICFVLALITFYPNVILQQPDAYWLLSFPLGGISLFFSIRSNKVGLIIVSVVTMLSFFILMGAFSVLDAINEHNNEANKSSSVIVLPEGTKPIHEGDIFNYSDKENAEKEIIFFARTKCPSCKKFEDIIVDAIEKSGASVRYYNLDEMPDSESDLVISSFNIERVPLLTEVQYGKIIRSTGSNNLAEITEFLEKGKE